MGGALPGRKHFLEGLLLLALGSAAGSLAVTLLHLFSPGAAEAAGSAAASVVSAKVEAAQSLGLKLEAGILLSNTIALLAVLLFPELAYRLEGSGRFAYSTVPRLMMALIGFESIGLMSPPLLSSGSYLLFLLYLLPHGALEFSALAIAYAVVRERSPAVPGALLAFLLLIPAAYLEVHLSLSFARAALALLGYSTWATPPD
ncbi:MAG: hypothetical protein GXO66_05185 [Euryarchaeota archaeon]|nr:hypothetical protein [Euryarchaeota archaeon]